MAKKRAKQTNVPGTARKVHKDITKAAEEYVDVRDERMELTEKEVELNEKLVQVMIKHDCDHYVDENAELEVIIKETSKKAKVKKYKPPKPKPAAND